MFAILAKLEKSGFSHHNTSSHPGPLKTSYPMWFPTRRFSLRQVSTFQPWLISEYLVPLVTDESLPTLFELTNQIGDAFPNNAELDSFKFPSTLGRDDVKKLKKRYSFPSHLKIEVPGPGDRTCNWHPERLFVYRGAIAAGLRFPLHPFVVTLLAQPRTRKGWVSIQHRSNVNHICNNASLPDSTHEWRHHFIVLYWKGGDWGQYFRPSFNHVVDFGSHIGEIKSHEFPDRDWLITGHENVHYHSFLTERIMVEVGMSRLSLEAADNIDKEPANSGQVTKRMSKKAELAANPPPPKVPEFLTLSQKAGKRSRNLEGNVKTAFQPSWGICEQDSIAGSSSLAMDWSKFSITPPDMVNLLARSGFEETEQLGCQAMYQMNSYFQTSLHIGKTLSNDLRASNKDRSRAFKEAREWEAKAHAAKEDASSYKGMYEALESKSHQGDQHVVDNYLNSDGFLEFMDQHDNEVRPSILSVGWKQAILAVQESYPGIIKSSRFPNPWVPAVEVGNDPPSDSGEEEAEGEEEEEEKEEGEESQSSQSKGRHSASPTVGKGKGVARPTEGKRRGVIREEKEFSSGSSGSSSSGRGG
ncbi:hypothetical protein POM88_034194 [Heracleum sosnowskyi]|uniref:Uncharacterized protein n=1 Tax=Heracleum sosnowskyi TaxID=360622 RepID=A0AAD8MCR7_9APIA|nr:hypothetical protein POM88_034194 [Heracleum sosnowskyi]